VAVQAAVAAITAAVAVAAAAAEQLQQRKLELDQQLTSRKAALAETVETPPVSKP
jgi:beta-lactamase class A